MADINIVDGDESKPYEQLSQPNELPSGELMQDHSIMHQMDTEKNAAVEPKHDTTIIGIIPPPEAAKKVAEAFPDLHVDENDLHITLVYLGKPNGVQLDRIHEAVADVAPAHESMECQLQGLGIFNHEDNGGRPFYVSVDAKGLSALRVDLVRALEDAGIGVPSEYDFTPHMTIAYTDPENIDIDIGAPDVTWISDNVFVMVGDEHVAYPLGEEHKKSAGGFGLSLNDLTLDAPGFSDQNVSELSELHNDGENTQEDPDLKLGNVEAPYSMGDSGPMSVSEDDDKKYNVVRGATVRMADLIKSVALPDEGVDENKYEDDLSRTDSSIPRSPDLEGPIYGS